jgi:glycosyltransferase involved in cell wall biosynthesis
LNVLVATTNADLNERLDVNLNVVLEHNGVSTIFFQKQWSNSFYFSHPFSRWIRSQVQRYDVVHIHAVFSHTSISAARACLEQRIPYVIRPLGTLDPWSMSQKPFRKKLFWSLGVKSLVGNATAVHYTSENERQSVETSLKLNHGVVIPLGVDHEQPENLGGEIFRNRFALLQNSPYIISLSRLHPKKGADLLLRVFLNLTHQERFSCWKLVLAGEGEKTYVEGLKKIVAEQRSEDRVLFPGWLEGGMKLAALQGASLLALPSKHENFGLCVAESMACGIPVLISEHVDLSGEVEAAQAGWVTTLDDAVFQCKLAAALTDEEERKRRGLAAKVVARKFSWCIVAADLEALYRNIMLRKKADVI